MRKVLSFVLVLSLVLGSFSMAFAATEAQASLSDIAGNANEEAITVNFNLGIIEGMPDGTFAPDQAVTRAQFAAMMTRALAVPDSALAGYTATSFKDTAGYGWAVPYLAFCQSKGILVGDGAGNVMPGRTVSVNEAMTMVLRAVGYTNNSAALVGVWPANYVTLAQNSDLYDDVATAVGVTRANAAQIIYNALTVDKVEVAADGTTKVLTGKSMLTTGLNCTAVDDVIVGNEDTLISLKAYIGQKVTKYVNKDGDIVAIAKVDSDTISGKFDLDIDLVLSGSAYVISQSGVTFTDDSDAEVNYKVKTSDASYFFKNGEEITTDTAILSSASVTINGKIVGKEIRSIDSVTAWNVSRAAKVTKSQLAQIADGDFLGGEFVTLKNKDIDTTSFALVGATSLDKIAVDNVVYVYWNSNNEITKIEVGTETVTGDVAKVNSKGDKFTVDGKTYEFAAQVSGDSKVPSAGDTVKFWLDNAGDIYQCDITSGATDKYGVVTDIDTRYDKVKVYTTDDEAVWMDYDSDYETTLNAISVGGLMAYSVDKKGKVDNVDTTIVTASHATLSGLILTATGGSVTVDTYRVASDAVAFGISASAFDVKVATGIANVETGKDLIASSPANVRFILDDNKIVAMVVGNAYTSKTADDVFAVIHEVSSVKNADGDKVQQIVGFANGAALDKLTNDTGVVSIGTAPALYKIEYDGDGAIKKAIAAPNATGRAHIDTGVVVSDVDGNSLQISSSGLWVPVAKDVIVYRAVMDDGAIDTYKVSDLGGINAGYTVYFFNTEDDDDSDGFEVIIYVTDFDN